MYRLVLVLSLLKVAAPSSIPIHKQIVNPDGESININIQVDIETSGGDEVDTGVAGKGSRQPSPEQIKPPTKVYHFTTTTEPNKLPSSHEVDTGVAQEGSSHHQRVCHKEHEECGEDHECCSKLTCHPTHYGVSGFKHCVLRPNQHATTTTEPNKLPSSHDVDTGVTQEGSRHHQGVCHKEHEECTEDHECCSKLTCHFATCHQLCLKTGETCNGQNQGPGGNEQKCCPTNFCDLDYNVCVSVIFL